MAAFCPTMSRPTRAMNSSGFRRNSPNFTGAIPERMRAATLRVTPAAAATSPTRSYVTPAAPWLVTSPVSRVTSEKPSPPRTRSSVTSSRWMPRVTV